MVILNDSRDYITNCRIRYINVLMCMYPSTNYYCTHTHTHTHTHKKKNTNKKTTYIIYLTFCTGDTKSNKLYASRIIHFKIKLTPYCMMY